MNYGLPKSLEVCGTEYEIRSDFRAALDVFAALDDPELSQQEKASVLLTILYTDFESIPVEHLQTAVDVALIYLNGGSEDAPQKKGPRLVSWEQDFSHIIAPINKIVGTEVRGLDYMHWWTFLSAYYEIGECTFSQIVRIRDMLAKGKKMEKSDREWYNRNRHLVDFKQTYTQEETLLLKQWGV